MDKLTLHSPDLTRQSIDKTTTETVWSGGGGFRVLDVAPSMFEIDGGLVFLADWMSNGVLAEATAAQLGIRHGRRPHQRRADIH